MIAGLNIYIRVGRIELMRVPSAKIISERHKPLTLMSITVPDPAGDVYQSVKDRDAVSIIFGYRDQTPAVWKGTVKGKAVNENKDQLVIEVVGPERPLTETIIKQTFFEETPEAIVKFCIEQAGLKPGRIDAIGVTFPRFVASSIPVWQVVRQCEHTCKKAYGFDMRQWACWMGKDGKVNWGPFDEIADIPVIESNSNLIEHSPGESSLAMNRVETFMLPNMMHSMKFRLRDIKRGIENNFRALKTQHIWEDSLARTFISYGKEYERY